MSDVGKKGAQPKIKDSMDWVNLPPVTKGEQSEPRGTTVSLSLIISEVREPSVAEETERNGKG